VNAIRKANKSNLCKKAIVDISLNFGVLLYLEFSNITYPGNSYTVYARGGRSTDYQTLVFRFRVISLKTRTTTLAVFLKPKMAET
jgi:hypothetical protein